MLLCNHLKQYNGCFLVPILSQPQLYKFILRYPKSALFKSFSTLVVDFFQHIFSILFQPQMDFSMTDGAEADKIGVHVQAMVKGWLHSQRNDMMPLHVGFMGALGTALFSNEWIPCISMIHSH